MATPGSADGTGLQARGTCPCWLWAAMLLSLAAVAGSIYLSVGLKLKACPLCLYQRVFVMGTAGVLVMGVLLGGARHSLVALLALPTAGAGLVVAGFHEYLNWNGTLECPRGLFGLGTAPQQSVVVHGVLVLLLLVAVFAGHKVGPEGIGTLGAVVLGVGFAAGAILSAPPLPAPRAYELPVDEDGCRPKYSPPPSPQQ